MSDGIAELDELHTAADSVLTSVREIIELAHQVADRSAQGKRPTKAQQKTFDRATAEYRTRSVHYTDIIKQDRFIKVWYLLLDTFQQAHQAESPTQDCPVWWLIEETRGAHCHETLNVVTRSLEKVVPRYSAASIEKLAEVPDDDWLDVVAGDEFAQVFNGEFSRARTFLDERYDEPYPLSAAMRQCAKRAILWRMNHHALGCAELGHRFVKDFCTDYYWSSNESKAGIQGEDRWERVETAALKLTEHVSRFREVPDQFEMLESIRKANVDDLQEIAVHTRSFATAHEAIDSIDEVVDEIIESIDCFTDEDRVVELAEVLKEVKIPDLTARLLIEKEKTEKWIELQFREEEALEEQDEAAAARRRALDKLDKQIEELESSEDGDCESEQQGTKRRKKTEKRNRGRPAKGEDPEEKKLERRFNAIYSATRNLKETCRECGISEAKGRRLRGRLKMRDRRKQAEDDRKRRSAE